VLEVEEIGTETNNALNAGGGGGGGSVRVRDVPGGGAGRGGGSGNRSEAIRRLSSWRGKPWVKSRIHQIGAGTSTTKDSGNGFTSLWCHTMGQIVAG